MSHIEYVPGDQNGTGMVFLSQATDSGNDIQSLRSQYGKRLVVNEAEGFADLPVGSMDDSHIHLRPILAARAKINRTQAVVYHSRASFERIVQGHSPFALVMSDSHIDVTLEGA
jgi:hypothetical protein